MPETGRYSEIPNQEMNAEVLDGFERDFSQARSKGHRHDPNQLGLELYAPLVPIDAWSCPKSSQHLGPSKARVRDDVTASRKQVPGHIANQVGGNQAAHC